MNIGIISDKAHAKSHAKLLRSQSHTVHLLGGNPSGIPETLDVLVCRPASSSHGGFDTAMSVKRGKGPTQVIIANGVKEIATAVASMNPAASKPPAKGTGPVIETLVKKLGVYTSLLHTDEAGPVVEWLASRKGQAGQEGLALWKTTRRLYKKGSVRGRIHKDVEGNEEAFGGTVSWTFTAPMHGGSRRVAVVSSDPEALSGLYERLPIFQTLEQAEKYTRDRRVASEAASKARRKSQKAKVQAVQASASKAKLLADLGIKTLTPTPPPPPPVPPVAKAWDSALKAAVGLVLAEMRAAKVVSLSVKSDGSVAFEREVLVVTTEQGSMKVSE
jgi:hypothetical protein